MEHKTKKKRGLPEAGTPVGGRVEHKTKKKRGLPEAGTPAGGRVEHKWSISQRKSGVLYDRSRSGRPYLLRQAPSPKASHFPLAGWSCPLRQDRAVHRRSEACMAGAQLASLPWLTVDSFGLPPPFPPPFPLDVRKYMLISIYYVDYGIIS